MNYDKTNRKLIMRKLLSFILLSTLSLTLYSSNNSIIDSKWDDLIYPPTTNYSKPDAETITNLPRLLVGEIISFKVDGGHSSSELLCFLNIQPDTIWIKKKPKKNPQLGKHYKLMPYYHGVETDSYYHPQFTPSSEVENVKFRVDSISSAKTEGSTYSTRAYCNLFLTNTITNEKLIWHYPPENSGYELILYSETVAQKMLPTGSKIYLKNNSSYSETANDFDPYIVDNVIYSCKFSSFGGSGSLEILLATEEDEDHLTMTYTYPKKRNHKDPKAISEQDYLALVENEKVYELDLIAPDPNTEYNFPFSFRFIAATSSKSTHVYQKLTKRTTTYGGDAEFFLSNTFFYIADKQSIHGTDYYIGLCDCKCFYIPTSDVTINSKEDELKLDSLLSCSQEIRDNFFAFNKFSQKYFEYRKLQEYKEELRGFEKYGISIVNWGIYDQSEYTDGTGLRIKFYNPTNKTIKYITINIIGYNSVNDPVSSGGKYTLSPKCVGPIEPEETGTYEFDYLWFTDLVSNAKIKSIVVQYMNGPTKTISNIDPCIWTDELEDYIFSNSYSKLKDIKFIDE